MRPSSSSAEALARIIDALWDRRTFLYQQARLALLVSIAIVLLIPNSYESTTRLMPPSSDKMPQLAMLSSVAGASNPLLGAAADLFGQKGTGALFIGVLQSDLLRNRIIDRYDLRKVYSVRLEQEARKKLADRTVISEDRKSGIITIVVEDHDRYRAQELATAYVNELNRLVTQLSTSAARREREFLEERLRRVKDDLDRSTSALAQFSSANTAINIPEQARAMLTAAATLNGQKIAAESELKGLEQIYAPSNVRVRSLKARIAELDNQLNQLGGEEKSPQAKNPGYPSIRELPRLGADYAKLYRETKTQESVLETLTVQYELAKVEEAKEIPTVRLLDPAEFPEKKSGPKRTLLALAIIVLWLLLAVAGKAGYEAYGATDPSHPLRRAISRVQRDMHSNYGIRLVNVSSSMYRRLNRPALRRNSELESRGDTSDHEV